MSEKQTDMTQAMMAAPGFAQGYEQARRHQAFGARLRLLREERGLSQSALAERAGVDQGDISRFEAGKWGKRGISFEMLEKILPLLGLQLEHSVQAAPDLTLSAQSREAIQEMSALL